jgi:hypothetical protein
MTRHHWSSLLLASVALGGFAGRACAADAPAPAAALPAFEEVYGVVRSNLTQTSDAELNRAAVLGFLSQFHARVSLAPNSTAAADLSNVPLVSKSVVLDGAYGLIRIARVASGLSQQVDEAYGKQASTNKLRGVILDLRFARGDDYTAAGQTADLFVQGEQPLLEWGGQTFRSTAKTPGIRVPVVLLVNQDTRAAAEALAAALRNAEGALIIGSPSAGQAFVFRDFALSTGQTLRVASGTIAVGNGEKLPATGVMPDIRITVSPEDEKAYFEDPYKVLPRPFALAVKPSTNDLVAGQSTNRPRRRLNEAELVRMQRDGIDFDAEPLPGTATATNGLVINDPALARAVDLLKGLALAAKRR